jgi:hypothetical protein
MVSAAERRKALPSPSDGYVCLRRPSGNSDFWHSPRDVAALIFLLLPLAVLAATCTDGTFSMQGSAKGLAQHRGFWIIFVTTPGLIALTGALLDRFVAILEAPGEYLSVRATDTQRAKFSQMLIETIESLSLRTRSRYVLYFGVIVGLSYFVINVIKTWNPYDTYGHDVFDAWAHQSGFFVTKLYLLPIFLLVYPISIFVTAHVSWSMVQLLRYLCDNDVLEISYFHEDNCGGTSCFGEINMMVMVVYTLLFAVLLGMLLTHSRTYFVTSSGLLFCSVAISVQSISAVWAIHAFVRKKKFARLREITKKLDDDLTDSLENDKTFRSNLLGIRNHVQGMSTFPYAANVALAVNALRLAPVLTGVFTFAKQVQLL